MVKGDSYSCGVKISYGNDFKDSYWFLIRVFDTDVNSLQAATIKDLSVFTRSLGISKEEQICVDITCYRDTKTDSSVAHKQLFGTIQHVKRKIILKKMFEKSN